MPPALREQTNHQGRRTRRCRSIEIAAVATAMVGQCYSIAKISLGAPKRKLAHCLLQPRSAASGEYNTREELCESRPSMPFAFDSGGPMLGQLMIPDAWNSARFWESSPISLLLSALTAAWGCCFGGVPCPISET